ncbi:MAG: hypothetical protein ABWY93_25830 [Mycobacterium sp.]
MASRVMARRRLAAGVGALALVAMGALSACGGDKTESPSTTTTPTTTSAETTAPSASPTEKGLEPGGGNKFTPTVKAPTPATAIPGDN